MLLWGRWREAGDRSGDVLRRGPAVRGRRVRGCGRDLLDGDEDRSGAFLRDGECLYSALALLSLIIGSIVFAATVTGAVLGLRRRCFAADTSRARGISLYLLSPSDALQKLLFRRKSRIPGDSAERGLCLDSANLELYPRGSVAVASADRGRSELARRCAQDDLMSPRNIFGLYSASTSSCSFALRHVSPVSVSSSTALDANVPFGRRS